jgi:DNA sulfur modification protein DndD
VKITQIKIRNFRQHRNVEIDLNSDQCDFVVIKGNNGAGKTNLLRALKWAIYGDIDLASEKLEQRLLSNSAYNLMKNGDYEETQVSLEFTREDGEIINIERSQSFKKTDAGVAPHGSSEVKILRRRDVKDGYEVEPDPSGWIENNLPKRFRPYFLFDGEQLNKFLQESDAPKIRSAIQEVAKIDVLHRIQEQLGAASTQLNQKAARLTGVDGERLASDLGEIEGKILRQESDISELELRYQKAYETEQDLDKQLHGQKDLETNINRKKEIDASLKSEELLLENARVEFNSKIRTVSPVALMAPALRALGNKVEIARANKVLPPPINLDYLKEILEGGTCICGTELSASKDHSAHLEKMIEDYLQVGEVGATLNEYATSYQTQLAKLTPQAEVITLWNQKITEKEKKIRALEKEQKELASELEGQDDETIRNLAVARREQHEIAYRARQSLDQARVNLEGYRKKKLDIEREIQKAASTNAESVKARNKAKFADEAAKVAKELYETMNTQVREAVSSSLENRFKSMVWKKNYFNKVSIDSDFKVSVQNKNGIELLDGLSSGETACLAFAFSLTLSKEAGLNFPMVVDTPMGRLGQDVQVNLADVLVDATQGKDDSPNHQIILLMTDTEYTERVAPVFAKRRPKVLQINFDTSTEETTVA